MGTFGYFDGLFGSLNTTSTTTLYGAINDYATIRSGSYQKLLNAYYGKNSSTSSTASELLKTDSSTDSALTNVKSASDAIVKSSTALYKNGSTSVFASNDIGKVVDGVNKFVSDYNDLITASSKSETKDVTRLLSNLKGQVNTYSSTLDSVGISIGSDGKLSVDQEKLKASSISTIKSVFNGVNSFTFAVASKATQIGQSALNASKGTLYSSAGVTSGYNVNSIFNEYL